MTDTPRNDNSFVKKDSWIGRIKSAFCRNKLHEPNNAVLQPLKNQLHHVDNRDVKNCPISVYNKKEISYKNTFREKYIVDKLKSKSDNRRAWASDRRKKEESSRCQRNELKQKSKKDELHIVNSEKDVRVKMSFKGDPIINDEKLLTKENSYKYENKGDDHTKNKDIKATSTTKSVFQNKKKKETKITPPEEETSDSSNVIYKSKGISAGKYFKRLKTSLTSMKMNDTAKGNNTRENLKCKNQELKKKIRPSYKEEKIEKGNEFPNKISGHLATKRIHNDRSINLKSSPIPKKRKNALNKVDLSDKVLAEYKLCSFKGREDKSRDDKVKMMKSKNIDKNCIKNNEAAGVLDNNASGDGCTTLMRQIHLYDEALNSSVSIFNGSHLSEATCSCGCMKLHMPITKSTQYRIDSSTSCSSIEYLRSYSGNLVMSANGKKPVLSDFIKYLPSL